MSYMNYIYRNNSNYNDDINSYQNKNIKLDYQGKSVSASNKSKVSIPQNLNYQNKNKMNENENYKNLNNNFNFSSSLKDQILSPGDDDISQNYDKNKFSIKKGSQYLDDDIIFNKLNFHYLNKNKNYLNNDQKNPKNDYTKINTNSSMSKMTKTNNKKTLILDLDETLVHSSFKQITYNNVYHRPDIFLTINFRNNNHNVYVLKRPYVHEFLKEMNKIYNIVIFTASVKEYANPLLDTLDTEKVIKRRLFREDCCIGPGGKFVKDLKVLNMNLKDLILVDNNPISYSYNKSNGVPIKTWHFDKTDQELIKLIPVLQFLSNVNDVRDYIPKLVENDEINMSKINILVNEVNNEYEQQKYLRPRAKSQKKFLAPKRGNFRNNNYGVNNIMTKNSNNNINNINIMNNKQRPYEDVKTNSEKNKMKNKNFSQSQNYYEMKANKSNNNMKSGRQNENLNPHNGHNSHNLNSGNSEHNNKERNIIDFNNTNKYYDGKNNHDFNYNYNNYLNNVNIIKKNSNGSIKDYSKDKVNIMKKEEENREPPAYSKDNIDGYNKKYSFENMYSVKNNYLINECKNYQKYKSQDIDYIPEIKKDNKNSNNNNLYISNTRNYNISNEKMNNNNNQYNIYNSMGTSKSNNNIKNNNNYGNKLVENQNNENKNYDNNYIFNYKTNYPYTTPQVNNKYISNFRNINNNNNNMSSNINNNNSHNNKNNNKNYKYNYIQENNNISIEYKNNLINSNDNKSSNKLFNNNVNNNSNNNMKIQRYNSFNYNNYYQQFPKSEYNYKYHNFIKENNINHINNINNINNQMSISQMQVNFKKEDKSKNNNINLDSKPTKDFNTIHSNTATNFYPSKLNNNNNVNSISNNLYESSNSNSNLNKYYDNLYHKEESKINSMLNKDLTDLKLDNNLKRDNSSYKISRETNYYIKRKSKMNKKKESGIDNELYMSYNNQKNIQNNNYLNNNNNYIYNLQQKYLRNENDNYYYGNNNNY